ncbi:MAG: hypothetical protein M3N23_03320 [Pseudomonadota bacterium]|nr:hypothetical protein [Pseudomonadota bacterium]
MRRCIAALLTIVSCATALSAPLDAGAPLAQSPAAALLARPVLLRGILGDRRVEMQLHMKANPDEGIEGDYLLADRVGRILLAGETDNDTIALEESENGSDISGQWDGRVEGGVMRGTWLSADGSVSKPFELKVVEPSAVASAPHPGKRAKRTAARVSP